MSDINLFLIVLLFVTIIYGFVGIKGGNGSGSVMAIMYVLTGPLMAGLIASLIRHYI